MSKVPINALNAIVHDTRYRDVNIRREICGAVERSPSTLSRVLDEHAFFDQNQSAKLGRKLGDEFDDDRWSECFVGSTKMILPRRFGKANGRHDDDACAASETLGDWIRAMNGGDKQAAYEALKHFRGEVIPDMEAETDAI